MKILQISLTISVFVEPIASGGARAPPDQLRFQWRVERRQEGREGGEGVWLLCLLSGVVLHEKGRGEKVMKGGGREGGRAQ